MNREQPVMNRNRLIALAAVLMLAVAAVFFGLGSCDSSGCCQCERACQDVSRASECKNICGSGGNYHQGKQCKQNKCQ
jgi:hypothetical protein